jgi:hypothetical protein
MNRLFFLPILGLFSLACPWPKEVEIQAPATFRPGEPVRLRALVSFPASMAGASGRGHLALQLPAGWEATGSYRLGERSYPLHPAPVVAAHHASEHRGPGTHWVGFVSFFHADLRARSIAVVEVTLRPPALFKQRAVIGIAAGLAPPYPGWDQNSGAQRSITLRPEP